MQGIGMPGSLYPPPDEYNELREEWDGSDCLLGDVGIAADAMVCRCGHWPRFAGLHSCLTWGQS